MRKMASNIAGFVIQRLRSLFKNGSPGACGIVEEGMAVGDCASSDKSMTFVLLSDSGRSENGGSGAHDTVNTIGSAALQSGLQASSPDEARSRAPKHAREPMQQKKQSRKLLDCGKSRVISFPLDIEGCQPYKALREVSMRRLAISLCMVTASALCGAGGTAYGQANKPAPAAAQPAAAPADAPAAPPAAEPPAAEPPAASLPPTGEATASEVATAKTPTDDVHAKTRWDDIAVLPRRYSLKARRVEFSPQYHFTLNNPLIRHHAVGAQINYFLSEALWLGVEGQYYVPQQSTSVDGTYFLIGSQDKALPAVNKLVFSALLDFGYVPVAGKFALFNRAIVHWEGYVTLGVGAFMSEVIPVKRSDPAFKTISAIFDVGVGSRLFLTKWLALNAFLKLYGYPDKFEPVANASFTRTGAGCSASLAGLTGTAADDAYMQCRKDNGSTTLVMDVQFGLGLSIFLPPKFDYKMSR